MSVQTDTVDELTTLRNRVAQLEEACTFAASVIKTQGLFDLSERMAYEKLTATLPQVMPSQVERIAQLEEKCANLTIQLDHAESQSRARRRRIAELSSELATVQSTDTFYTQFMTRDSRKTQTWLDGPGFSDLERAKLYCAIIRALGPAQHTQVLDDAGERAYFVDNEWAAIFDLVFWAKLDNPEAIANQFAKLFKRMSRR